MHDSYGNSLQPMVAEDRHAGAPDARSRLLLEPLLGALGWAIPPRHGEVALALWPAALPLPPAYVCSLHGVRRFIAAAVPASPGHDTTATLSYFLRRRAWSAGIPVAVLAAHDGVAVYDARIRPRAGDAAHVARRLHVCRPELQERQEALWEFLSKTAVRCGGFDTFAYAPAKRTVAARHAFVSDAQRWRRLLGVPPGGAQAVLDGIVFWAMARARGLMSGPEIEQLEAALDVRASLADALAQATQGWGEDLVAEARAHLHQCDGTGLRTVVRELVTAPVYDLASLPDDIAGHVFEAFLTASSAAATSVQKRKAQGVFYTPAPVVQHIVRHVVRRLLPHENAAALVNPGRTPPRILDPACGAGAFLVEVYRALLDAALTHYLRADPMVNPRLTMALPGVWRLTLTEKCRILTACVFGVDIDPAAVAATRRALLLTALSGEPDAAPRSQKAFKLPSLAANIRCGNMLIGTDFSADPKVTDEQVEQAQPFDWRTAFAAAAQAGGFDAIVGNPPYGSVFTDTQKAYLKTRFEYQGDRPDSYLLFIEMALRDIVRVDGWCGWVIPNPWLVNVKQRRLRNFVLENATIEQIVHFGCAMFKAKAVVDTQIVTMRRRPCIENDVHTHQVHALEPSGGIDLASATTLMHEQAVWRMQSDAPINIFLDEPRRALAAKIKAAGVPASTLLRVSVGMKPYQVGKGRPKQTAKMVQERIYDATAPQGPDYRRYLRGADVRRFIVSPQQERWVRYGPWLAEPRLAANFDAPKKLLLRQTSDHLVAAIDDDGRICMNNLHVLTPRETESSLDGFMGLFNSRLMNWYYQVLNPERGEALAEVKKHHVESLPVPHDPAELAAVATLAREVARYTKMCVVSEDKVGTEALAAARERLDARVYTWFKLTAEEIGIIMRDATQA